MKSKKGQKRSEEILDAATGLLNEEGFYGFSMRRVADRLEIRLSNVQYYFQTPAELVKALFNRALDLSIETFSESAGSETLEGLVAFVLEEQEDTAYCLLFWEMWAMSGRDSEFHEVMSVFYERYIALVERVVSQTNSCLKGAELRRRAVIITSLFEGLSLLRRDEGVLFKSKARLDKSVVDAVNAIVTA